LNRFGVLRRKREPCVMQPSRQTHMMHFRKAERVWHP
jgi:hypothetical protein